MSFAYSVAIKLTVANLASQGVRMLANDLLGAHGNAVKLEGKLKALKMIAVGYGMERAGAGILGFMDKAVDASKSYTHQIALMNAAGMTHKEIAGSIASAWSTSRNVITSSATENLHAIQELRSVFGQGEGMQHAYAVLPVVQRAKAILESLTGKEQDGVAFDMIKAIEVSTKGAVTVPAMLRQSEAMTKALTAFGGTLTVSDFHQTLKQAKAAAPFLSDDFKYTILPTIMQEMKSGHGGAQAAGTAIATMFGTIKGHAIQTRMIPAWMDAGLISANNVVADKHHKGMSKIAPGGVAGEDLFSSNPYEWAQRFLVPARDRLMQKDHLDEIGAYYALTGNRNTAFMMQTLANKGAQIARDQKLIETVGSSYGAYQKLLKTDPQLAEQAMHNQWQNVLSILGFQILPRLIPYMIRFANLLDGIAQFMERHPTLTSGIAIGGAAAGVGLTLGGKALMTAGIMKYLGIGLPSLNFGSWMPALLTAGRALMGILPVVGEAFAGLVGTLGGPIVWAIAGVAAAGVLIYRNWGTVGPFLAKQWSIIRAIFHVSMTWITNRARSMWAAITPYLAKAWSILKALGSMVSAAFGSFYTTITGFLGKLWNWIANSPIGRAIGWAGGQLGAGLSSIGATLGKNFDQTYKWSENVNRRYEGSPYVPSGGGRPVHVTTNLHVDGHKMATVVTKHQSKAAGRPNTGGSNFDGTRSPRWPSSP